MPMHRARLTETVVRAIITKIIIYTMFEAAVVDTLHRPKHILLFENISWFFFPSVRLPPLSSNIRPLPSCRYRYYNAVYLNRRIDIYTLLAARRIPRPLTALHHTGPQHNMHMPRRAMTVL